MNSKTDKTIIVLFGISLILAFKSIFSNICFRLINPFLNLLSACQKPLHTNLAFRELKPKCLFFFSESQTSNNHFRRCSDLGNIFDFQLPWFHPGKILFENWQLSTHTVPVQPLTTCSVLGQVIFSVSLFGSLAVFIRAENLRKMIPYGS